ncbi:ASCH domain-containing protein [Erythrobacter sp. T5W1-R]|uniref:ASCH domain-containing protein n=1 Tax=Erythrobacter sp. T5W1-R TaxID=3101752 RepID=UPI002AFFDD59|nr:ASCH domain-containing protein [Erythrobacter sp. T5W1-R]MEA1619488.1 ASCH domain-containing protein [Erythrobacter sp. T5W1-R]
MSEPSFWAALPRSAFGDSPELADELLNLILAGRKRATCWSAAADAEGGQVGAQWVAEDGKGRPRAILETVEIRRIRFKEVDEDFAAAEGEGDLSLGYWRSAHQSYFERNGGFDPEMLLWCERFRLVSVLPEPD